MLFVFLCRCFARLQCRFVQLHIIFSGGIVVCAYQRFCFPCSCSLLFFHCSVFSPCWPLAFLIFSRHRLYEIFMFFSQRNSSPLFWITPSNIKNNVEKDTTLLLFFLSKSSGGHTISPPKHLELSVVSYLLTELFYIGMPVVQTDGRAYDHVITKFSYPWCSAITKPVLFLNFFIAIKCIC